MKVDIIIPVHNRWEHTKQTLDSLLKNTPKELYKLYIINDKSDQYTTADLFGWFAVHSVEADMEYISNADNIGPGASRNFVCNHITEKGMRGDYLYHSDNDVYFTPGWLEKLTGVYSHLEEKGLRLLGGSCHPYLQNNSMLYCDVCNTPVGIKDAVSGYSQLMTWETWDKYGPFDETMRNAEKKIMGSEDWAFCQKIVRDGFKVGSIEPEVVIPTGKTNTYGELATGSETFKQVEGVKVQ